RTTSGTCTSSCVAIIGEHLAALRDVLAVVTAETPEEVHVPDVVRKRLPVRPHRGEVVPAEYPLHFGNHSRDFRFPGRCDLRIAGVVVLVDDGPDAVRPHLSARVGVFE